MHSHATITGRFSCKEPNYSNVPKSLGIAESVAVEGSRCMLLRSRNIFQNGGITQVPEEHVGFRFTLFEGGYWNYVRGPLSVYLDVVKEIQQPGAQGAVQMISPKRGWVYDADLKRVLPSSHGWRIR